MIVQKYTLDKARKAVQTGNHADALEKYESFFEQTFQNSAKYGVRLSYCLAEWKELGKIYPEALKRLESKRDESLFLFNKSKEPERFHDYLAICEILESPKMPLKEFLRLHNTNKKLSTKIVRFIWDKLIENKKWEICLEYLNNPLEKYESYLHDFDTVFKKYVHNKSTSFEKKIIEYTLNLYIKNVTNILLVLKHNNNIEDYTFIRQRVSSDLASRELSKLEILIERKMYVEYIR